MKKIISMLMALTMFLSLTTPALAVTSEEETAVELTMEEAVEILGITMEEVEGLELMPMPTTTTNAERKLGGIPSELPPGVYYEEVPLTTFVGAIHKIKGPRFKFSYTIGKIGEGSGCADIHVRLIFTDPNRFGDGYRTNIASGNKIESIIYKQTNNHDIYFQYTYTAGSAMPQGNALLVIVVYQTP